MKTTEKTAERRQAVRESRSLVIEHKLYKRNGIEVNGVWRSSITEDMSLVGILFNSDIPYHIEDILEARVKMSGLDIFRGFGRVVRVEEDKSKDIAHVAIAFLDEKSKYLKPAE